jgi:hypothetical protein
MVFDGDGQTRMNDAGYRGDEAARLEAALERIARARLGAPAATAHAPPAAQAGPPAPELARIAARLDAVIAELRAALRAG